MSSVHLENGLPSTPSSPLRPRGFQLALLSFQALGIIYADLATSPLYTLNGIWSRHTTPPTDEDVVGAISAIIWALTLLALIKYVWIALRFGTKEGEGGTFALFQGLYPKEQDWESRRFLTVDSDDGPAPKPSPYISERFRWPVLLWCLFGTALTMADGIFTPAVSITSAVAGIATARPSIHDELLPISIVIIVLLFICQQFGTAKLAVTFAPVASIWLLLLMAIGIYNVTFYPPIFRAFDPSRAVMLFVRTRDYDILAGVLLALTGCEAVFANLGQFNALSIQLPFTLFVYPSVILAYLGQGARLVIDGDAVMDNIFYRTIPGKVGGPFYWVVFVFAILATVIVSQSMITATFSLVQQMVNLKSLPPMRIIFTSSWIQGQMYIPLVNWILMAIIVIVIAAFSDPHNLTNAYGFAVATVMITTTVLLAIHMRQRKGWPISIAIGYFIIFGFFDGLFWGASLKKVPEGAWVPLLIGLLLEIFMVIWTWAKGLEDSFDSTNVKSLKHLIQPELPEDDSVSDVYDAEYGDQSEKALHVPVEEKKRDVTYCVLENPIMPSTSSFRRSSASDSTSRSRKPLVRTPICAVFHKFSRGRGIPYTFGSLVRQWQVLPRVVIFLSSCPVATPVVAPQDRYAVKQLRTVDGFYDVCYYIGFREQYDVQVADIMDVILSIENHDPKRIAELRQLAEVPTHIIPHYHVKSRTIDVPKPLHYPVNWARKCLIEVVYRRIATVFSETDNWKNSPDEIVRVGISARI